MSFSSFSCLDKMNEPSGLAVAFLRSQTSKDEDINESLREQKAPRTVSLMTSENS